MRHKTALMLVLVVAAAVASVAGAAKKDVKLSLVAYSTPREAYNALIPEFQKTPAGNGVSFSQSYAASGDQARAVKAGLNADIVALSLAPDVDELVAAGLVDRKWSRQSYRGIVTNSLVVFVVRDGNPKKIRGWNDLVRAGVDVVTPNPFTSGGARWNVMAAYGAQRKLGKTDKQAQDYLLKLFRNVVSQDKSARDSLQTFNAGRGDVLLAYENEALFAQSRGQKLPFVIPRSTILIENPIAVLKTSEHKQEATAFLRFLRTPGAQRTFAENGYRPVSKAVASEFPKKFPVRPGQFTIDQLGLGGWDKVQKRFFDARTGVMARIEREVGGVTG
ncbi:MAG: sulfate/thiosulfate transport system substrate-binding protein [Gaiellaceae bacterium]|nr:sulfate/thiosulfate transport system substrate-binding protein [Gaiellaceae bacterium]